MKIQLHVMTLVIASLTAVSTFASVKDMAGVWNGTGTSFSLNGEIQGTYAIEMTDTLQTDGSVASVINVAIPNSPNKEVNLTLRDSAHGFSMTGSLGNGGASCLQKGLCEGYFGDSNGTGVAITFITDGPNNLRLVKTDLQNGKATQLFLEKYVRVQTK